METKFLSDGRKVAVLGKLNAVESIVQEIFVTDSGVEIPSGENFTTKNLHDEPVKSYQQKQLERIELDIKSVQRKKEDIESEITGIRNKLSAYRDILKSVSMLADNINEQDFSHFLNVITGNIKYAVPISYSTPVEIEDAIEYMSQIDNQWRGGKYEGLRLISVLGSSEGDIGYKLNRWHDGSGSYTSVMFFGEIDEARNYIKNRLFNELDKLEIDEFILQKLRGTGIKFTSEESKKLKERAKLCAGISFGRNMESFNKSKANHEERLANIDKSFTD